MKLLAILNNNTVLLKLNNIEFPDEFLSFEKGIKHFSIISSFHFDHKS